MSPTPRQTPRIPPVTQPTPEQAELLDKTRISADPPANVFATLAHNPTMLKRFNVLGGYFMGRNTLSARQRELTILRAAHRSDCLYEFVQHRRIALDGGLLDRDEVARVVSDDASAWSDEDRALIEATDELCAHPHLADALWERLDAFLDDVQLMEFTLLVGFYRGLAGFINSVGVPLDETFIEADEADWPAGRAGKDARLDA